MIGEEVVSEASQNDARRMHSPVRTLFERNIYENDFICLTSEGHTKDYRVLQYIIKHPSFPWSFKNIQWRQMMVGGETL